MDETKPNAAPNQPKEYTPAEAKELGAFPEDAIDPDDAAASTTDLEDTANG